MPRRTGGAGFPGAPSDAPDGAPAALRSSVAGSGHGRVPGGVTERGEDTGSEDSTPRKGAPSVLRALPSPEAAETTGGAGTRVRRTPNTGNVHGNREGDFRVRTGPVITNGGSR